MVQNKMKGKGLASFKGEFAKKRPARPKMPKASGAKGSLRGAVRRMKGLPDKPKV